MLCEWMKTYYLKIYGQTMEVNKDVTNWNQDGLMGQRKMQEDARKLGCRNWLAAAQDRGHWQHMLEEAKSHPGLYSQWWWWFLTGIKNVSSKHITLWIWTSTTIYLQFAAKMPEVTCVLPTAYKVMASISISSLFKANTAFNSGT